MPKRGQITFPKRDMIQSTPLRHKELVSVTILNYSIMYLSKNYYM
jgi:hypothetical protein